MRSRRLSIAERVGLALQRRRKALGFSQEGLAEELDMHRTYYSSIERGKKNLQLNTLERVAAALNARPWEILKDADA